MSKIAVSAPQSVTLAYRLAELPSSQHKAGLVGLVLLMRDLSKEHEAELEILELSESKCELRLTEKGVKLLFDQIYAASEELQPSSAKWKDVEPVKIEEREDVDPRTKKVKTKKFFFYPHIVPRGSFLELEDRSPTKIWVKLWRDMVWTIMRGVPATRKPFEDRANGKDSADVMTMWKQLNNTINSSVDLPSTYFLGAQSVNAEGVSFKDRSRFQFLLHFWTLVAQIYVPQSVDRDNKRTFEGFCIAVPDVSSLEWFCDDYKLMLGNRKNELAGFRPRESIIEIPEEAGLDVFRRITEVVSASTAKLEPYELVFGVDLFHMTREGNNVRLSYSSRIEPNPDRDRQYADLRIRLKDSLFKHTRLTNLVKNRPWYYGFDKLLSELPIENGLCSYFFSQDAKESFKFEDEKHKGGLKMSVATNESRLETVCLESLVLKIMDGYVRRKLKDKYDLEWSKIQNDPKKKTQYIEKKEGLGKECFYAIRSRTEREDFINYFASNICSVPHWMSQEEYLRITKELYNETEKIRTLSMLALSARIGRTENKEDEGDE